MVRWLRICSLASWVLLAAAAPVSACGPFLYDNASLDQFSLLDPGILNSGEWTPFLAFGSPAYGQETLKGSGDESGEFLQPVIHPGRINEEMPPTASNLTYAYDCGSDPLTVTANEAWWTGYFQTVRHRTVTPEELKAALYGPDRPRWLDPADRDYLSRLDGAPDDLSAVDQALAAARDPRLPVPLRHRWAFWAVRDLAMGGDDRTLAVFREFCPGPASDLPLARAQGWAASQVAKTDPKEALALWLDLFARWPDLRVQTFMSLSGYTSQELAEAGTPVALVARYFLDGRDFSPETLGALALAEKAAGGDGTWTETVFYSMAEQVEKEAGVFALFGLVDPREVSPSGLYTSLVDQAQGLADRKVQPVTKTWWLIAAYLCLYDGNTARAQGFLDLAKALPSRNPGQDRQAELLAALVRMDGEKDWDWSPELQKQVVSALDWGKALNAPGHNRGLYHTVAVLAAQKYLARGQNPQAAMAFGLVQGDGGPYSVASDDSFWSLGWTFNNSVNLLMDALMTDGDIEAWRTLLKAKDLGPLTARLAAHPFISDRDLTWWEAHRALRRGQAGQAQALLRTLGGDGSVDSPVFSKRTFSYSLDLDPLEPEVGRGMRTVGPLALASVMAKVDGDAKAKPSSQTLLTQGEFWFSLQLSGLPLLFCQPPKVISFVNGNYEYYGYDGRDVKRTTAQVGEFPLGRPARTDDWALRLNDFYRNEFSTLDRARAAFHAVLARHDDPGAEFRALLFLQALDGNRYRDLAGSRYESLPLAQTFRTTCEDFKEFLK